MPKNFPITINVNVPAIKKIDELVRKFEKLTLAMSKVNKFQSVFNPKVIGNEARLVSGVKKTAKKVRIAWTTELSKSKKFFSKATKNNYDLVAQEALKDREKILNKRKSRLVGLGSEAPASSIKKLSKEYEILESDRRKRGIQIAQEEEKHINSKRALQERTANERVKWMARERKLESEKQSGLIKTRAATRKEEEIEASAITQRMKLEDRARLNRSKGLDKIIADKKKSEERLGLSRTSDINKERKRIVQQNSAIKTNNKLLAVERDRLKVQRIGRKLGPLYNLNELRKRRASVISIEQVEKRINAIMKDRLAVARETRRQRSMGVKRPQLSLKSGQADYSHIFARDEKAKRGLENVRGPVERLSSVGLISEKSIKSMSKFRAFANDTKSFIHTQVRWFAAAGIIFGTLSAMRSGISAAIEFEKAIIDIAAVTGATDQQLRMLAATTKEISLVTPQSATELALLSRTLVQAGLDVGQVAHMLEDIAKVATISGEAIADVGSAFTTAVFAWKMTSKETELIGNTLAATLNFSRLQIGDLATAYSYVASTANQFNLSFVETNAALAVFSNLGIRASTMSTSFVQFLSALAKPPSAFKKAIEGAGMSYEKFVGVLNDSKPDKFARIIKGLERAGIGVGDAFRILQVRTSRLVAAGLNVGSPAFFEMSKRIRETTQLSEGFKKAMGSVSNQLAKFKNRLVAISINLFNSTLPLMKAFISGASSLAQVLVRVSDGISIVGNKSVFITAAILGVVVALTKYGTAIKSITQITAVFTAVSKASPIFTIVAISAAALYTIGLVKSMINQTESYSDSVARTNKEMKAFQATQKESDKIWKDSTALVSQYRKILDDLKFDALGIEFPVLQTDRINASISNMGMELDTKIQELSTERRAIQEAMIKIKEDTKFTSGPIMNFLTGGMGGASKVALNKLKAQFEDIARMIDHIIILKKSNTKELSKGFSSKMLKDFDVINNLFKEAAKKPIDFREEYKLKIKAITELLKKEYIAESGHFDLGSILAPDSTAPEKAKALAKLLVKIERDYLTKVNEEKKKYRDIDLKGVEDSLQRTKDAIQSRLDLKTESPLEAAKAEIQISETLYQFKKKNLEMDKEAAQLEINKKSIQGDIDELTRNRLSDVEKLLKIRQAIVDTYDMEAGKLNAAEALGANVDKQRALYDYGQKLLKLQQHGLLTAQQTTVALKKRAEAMDWANQARLSSGFWDALKTGTKEASKGWSDMYAVAVRVGSDAISALQSQTSDFFFNIITAEGYNKDEHQTYWDFIRKQASDFLQGLAKSFMQTLTDIYSQMLISGLVKWLSQITKFKYEQNSQTTTAIGQEATLTGVLTSQAVMVATLTSAYWALAMAKTAAGMLGGIGSGAGIPGSMLGPSEGPGAFATNFPAKFHSGGIVPGSTEKAAILMGGEGVLSRKGMKTLGDLNSGTAGGGQTVNNYYMVQAIDPKSFDSYLKTHGKNAVTQIIAKDLSVAGATRSAVRSYG